jgi:PX domain/Fas apoptotic inhibitory molecule (FAIM1)
MAAVDQLDIFDRRQWPGPGTFSFTWLHDDQETDRSSLGRRQVLAHRIQFRHSQITGNWVLVIDGRIEAKGFEPLMNRVFDVSFLLEGKECVIAITGIKSVYYNKYSLKISDEEIKELRDMASTGILFGDHRPRSVTIPDCLSTAAAVMYQISVETRGGKKVLVERRYSEFSVLDAMVRTSVPGHLLSSLPILPSKVYNPFFDQSSDAFVTSRRLALELYINQILGMDKIVLYGDVLSFLGVDPLTGEPTL